MDVVPGAWAPWPDTEGRVGTLSRCHVVAPSGLSGVSSGTVELGASLENR